MSAAEDALKLVLHLSCVELAASAWLLLAYGRKQRQNSMALLASSASISPLARNAPFAGKSRSAEKHGRCRALVVRASKDETESRWVDAPKPPPSILSAESVKVSTGTGGCCGVCREGQPREPLNHASPLRRTGITEKLVICSKEEKIGGGWGIRFSRTVFFNPPTVRATREKKKTKNNLLTFPPNVPSPPPILPLTPSHSAPSLNPPPLPSDFSNVHTILTSSSNPTGDARRRWPSPARRWRARRWRCLAPPAPSTSTC